MSNYVYGDNAGQQAPNRKSTQPSSQDEPFTLHTPVPGFGTIEAVKTSDGHRDYLLKDTNGTVTWLDHEAVKAALKPAPHPTDDELRNHVHMTMLAKSGSAIEFGELTVIPLGHAVSIALALLSERERLARIDELKHVYAGGPDLKIWHRNTSGMAGEWLTIDERLADLEASIKERSEDE